LLGLHRFGQQAHPLPPARLPAIVLGARVFPDGTPSRALVDRVALGVRLLQDGVASSLVFTGGSPDTRPTEAAVMQQLALAAGVIAEKLTLEAYSRSTFDNARHCAALLPTREVLLVTCDFHLWRACAQFRRHGFTVWPQASKRTLSRLDRVKVTALELGAVLRRPTLW
jgi:uncharacterized SAM-binding protein YcdF (DUF218 family)